MDILLKLSIDALIYVGKGLIALSTLGALVWLLWQLGVAIKELIYSLGE